MQTLQHCVHTTLNNHSLLNALNHTKSTTPFPPNTHKTPTRTLLGRTSAASPKTHNRITPAQRHRHKRSPAARRRPSRITFSRSRRRTRPPLSPPPPLSLQPPAQPTPQLHCPLPLRRSSPLHRYCRMASACCAMIPPRVTSH